MAEREYRRLTRPRIRRGGFFSVSSSRSSLWLGQDHLLGIDSSGFTEEYKRFYFRDIQAITLAWSKRRLIWNWVLAVPTAVCLALWVVDLISDPSMTTGGIITGVVFTALFAVPLLANNLLGPTCNCQIRTAVQTEDVSSLSRLRGARRVLERIRPLIAEAQGELVPEEIPNRMRELAGAPATAARAAPQGSVVPEPGASPRPNS